MKCSSKLLTFILSYFLSLAIALGGGLVTNSNQSAQYLRNPARDASNEIDAVYYNPAALTQLADGLHLSINNQSIFQDKKINTTYQFLNKEYKGKASAPLSPGIYAAYKTDSFAFSLGFNPIGGGGSAEYDKGLPSFEMGLAELVPGLSQSGIPVTSYSSDIYFKGESVYWGIQGGISYKINDMVSAFAGVRYIIAQNTYTGHLKAVYFKGSDTLNIPATLNGAADQMKGAAAQYKAAKEQFTAAGLADSAAKYAELEATYTEMEAQTRGKAGILSKSLNQEADVEQTGSGITPIFGLNFSLLENKLKIGLKYELNTTLELENNTKKDAQGNLLGVITGMTNTGELTYKFPDKAKTKSDIPALLAVGISYDVAEKLRLYCGLHYYFDKNAQWETQTFYSNNKLDSAKLQDLIDNNYMELAIGIEYSLTDELMVSTGYNNASSGVSNNYQTDMNYSLSSNSFGIGARYKASPTFEVNAGLMYTMYTTRTHDYSHNLSGTTTILPATDEYNKSNLLFALGLNIHLFGNE